MKIILFNGGHIPCVRVWVSGQDVVYTTAGGNSNRIAASAVYEIRLSEP